MIEKTTVFFTMVMHPVQGWIRTGPPYRTKEIAASWITFVKEAWRVNRAKVSQFTLIFNDGELTESCLKTLDEKFNFDSPDKGFYEKIFNK